MSYLKNPVISKTCEYEDFVSINFQHTGKWATVWSSKVKTDFTKLQKHFAEVSMSHHFEIGLSICFL